MTPTYVRAVLCIALAWALAVPASSTPETTTSESQPTTSAPSKVVWLGADDKPLPFETPEEVVEFLRTAEIESIEDIGVGVTKPKRLLLVQGDLRSKAVFRYVSIIEDKKRFSDGRFEMFFRDSFMNEVAAYKLSRLLGMDNLPPAVERRINREPGSVQMWVENAMMETERKEKKLEPPDRTRFNRQFFDMNVFDNLINNIDRNSGNILIDANWKVWMIDHTRSFARAKELPAPKEVLGCSRKLFANLRALDKDTVTEVLSPYLSKHEVRALLERRKRLVQRIEERIAKHGEDWVLFNYGDPNNRVRVTHGQD